jgi:hypothetical protein
MALKRDLKNCFAECFTLTLGKEAFAECFFGTRQINFFAESRLSGARQSLLCRAPEKKRSAKPPALGKEADSGSGSCFIWH